MLRLKGKCETVQETTSSSVVQNGYVAEAYIYRNFSSITASTRLRTTYCFGNTSPLKKNLAKKKFKSKICSTYHLTTLLNETEDFKK